MGSGEEIQTKGTDNLVNTIIAENFPNLKKETGFGRVTPHCLAISDTQTHYF
jgi:hypothetical protein